MSWSIPFWYNSEEELEQNSITNTLSKWWSELWGGVTTPIVNTLIILVVVFVIGLVVLRKSKVIGTLPL